MVIVILNTMQRECSPTLITHKHPFPDRRRQKKIRNPGIHTRLRIRITIKTVIPRRKKAGWFPVFYTSLSLPLTLSTATDGLVEACATRDRNLLSYPEELKVALKPNTRACRSEHARLRVRSASVTSYSNVRVW